METVWGGFLCQLEFEFFFVWFGWNIFGLSEHAMFHHVEFELSTSLQTTLRMEFFHGMIKLKCPIQRCLKSLLFGLGVFPCFSWHAENHPDISRKEEI